MNIIQYHTKVNYTPGNKGRQYIVLHYTGNATDTAKGNASYFRSVNRNASAHFFVDESSIYEVVSPDDTAWAVGRNYGGSLFGKCTNNNSISIEMCSRNGIIQEKTIQNSAELTKSIMARYGIPESNVVRHYDVCKKLCPGWAGWVPSNESAWIDFKNRLKTSATKTEGEDEMRCTYQIEGNNTIYYFDGYHVCALNDMDQLNILRTIYKDNNGRDLPHYKWSSKAAWYTRLLQVINLMEQQNK